MFNTPFMVTLENVPVILPNGEDVLASVTVRGSCVFYIEVQKVEGTYEDEEGVIHPLDRATLDSLTVSADLYSLTVEELARPG